ncbi:hypothetical protein H9P43_005457 [Blastocladiella emersonii ATCC 22665]|nr:hypothetical protein H9P43_005457 [Blastocladiella emersonii ATCC 22665]
MPPSIPKHVVSDYARFIRSCGSRLLVITGAGVSTPSNIPDYRGPNGAYVKNKDYKPIQYQEFMGNHYNRQRYWARSMLGYGTVANAKPNVIHDVLADWQRAGRVLGIVTQNVDSLHIKAGATEVVELHGTLAEVVCQGCKHTIKRVDYQHILASHNPTWSHHLAKAPALSDNERLKVVIPPSHKSPGETAARGPSTTASPPPAAPAAGTGDPNNVRPDGDVDVALEFDKFKYPSCPSCDTGVLKPGVVFFGENIDPAVKQRAAKWVENASGILVLGTTLTTFSAFRLVREARGPVWCINQGPTRADDLFARKFEAPVQEMLPLIHDELMASPPASGLSAPGAAAASASTSSASGLHHQTGFSAAGSSSAAPSASHGGFGGYNPHRHLPPHPAPAPASKSPEEWALADLIDDLLQSSDEVPIKDFFEAVIGHNETYGVLLIGEEELNALMDACEQGQVMDQNFAREDLERLLHGLRNAMDEKRAAEADGAAGGGNAVAQTPARAGGGPNPHVTMTPAQRFAVEVLTPKFKQKHGEDYTLDLSFMNAPEGQDMLYVPTPALRRMDPREQQQWRRQQQLQQQQQQVQQAEAEQADDNAHREPAAGAAADDPSNWTFAKPQGLLNPHINDVAAHYFERDDAADELNGNGNGNNGFRGPTPPPTAPVPSPPPRQDYANFDGANGNGDDPFLTADHLEDDDQFQQQQEQEQATAEYFAQQREQWQRETASSQQLYQQQQRQQQQRYGGAVGGLAGAAATGAGDDHGDMLLEREEVIRQQRAELADLRAQLKKVTGEYEEAYRHAEAFSVDLDDARSRMKHNTKNLHLVRTKYMELNEQYKAAVDAEAARANEVAELREMLGDVESQRDEVAAERDMLAAHLQQARHEREALLDLVLHPEKQESAEAVEFLNALLAGLPPPQFAQSQQSQHQNQQVPVQQQQQQPGSLGAELMGAIGGAAADPDAALRTARLAEENAELRQTVDALYGQVQALQRGRAPGVDAEVQTTAPAQYVIGTQYHDFASGVPVEAYTEDHVTFSSERVPEAGGSGGAVDEDVAAGWVTEASIQVDSGVGTGTASARNPPPMLGDIEGVVEPGAIDHSRADMHDPGSPSARPMRRPRLTASSSGASSVSAASPLRNAVSASGSPQHARTASSPRNSKAGRTASFIQTSPYPAVAGSKPSRRHGDRVRALLEDTLSGNNATWAVPLAVAVALLVAIIAAALANPADSGLALPMYGGASLTFGSSSSAPAASASSASAAVGTHYCVFGVYESDVTAAPF